MVQFEASDFRSPQSSTGNENSTCVDLACGGGVVELRDSKVEFGSSGDHRIRLSYAEFDAYQRAVRAGVTVALPIEVAVRPDGWHELRPADATPGTPPLRFAPAEIAAFHHDIHTGHYDQRILTAA